MDPIAKLIILFLAHAGLIKLYFVLSHRLRGQIQNPQYEAITIGLCSFMLGIVTANLVLGVDEKHYLWLYIPLTLIGQIFISTILAKLYILKYFKKE